jgi:hypothetical protein
MSEPVRLGEILPEVLADIKRRMHSRWPTSDAGCNFDRKSYTRYAVERRKLMAGYRVLRDDCWCDENSTAYAGDKLA